MVKLDSTDVIADLHFEDDGLILLNYSWDRELKLNSFLTFPKPTRFHELWKSTCFEAFIRPEGTEEYWEINLSPINRWNVYRFKSYRKPQPPAEDLGWELLEMNYLPGLLVAKIKHDFSPDKKFEVGLACIFDNIGKEMSCWAAKQARPKPDFHDASTFILKR